MTRSYTMVVFKGYTMKDDVTHNLTYKLGKEDKDIWSIAQGWEDAGYRVMKVEDNA